MLRRLCSGERVGVGKSEAGEKKRTCRVVQCNSDASRQEHKIENGEISPMDQGLQLDKDLQGELGNMEQMPLHSVPIIQVR